MANKTLSICTTSGIFWTLQQDGAERRRVAQGLRIAHGTIHDTIVIANGAEFGWVTLTESAMVAKKEER